jgi:hypothetical protein
MIETVFLLLLHSPQLMLAAEPSTFPTERACKAEARKRSKGLGHGSLYYECIPHSTGEPRSFWFAP